jgi:hypothetical protein
VAERLAHVRRAIGEAAKRAHRDPASVKLVAVSKYHSVEAIAVAYAASQRDFGENYAQELAHKAQALAERGLAPTWHFIGQLQRNKVATVVQWADVIHSVDSVRLAQAISRAVCAKYAPGQKVKPMAILLQVDFAKEARRGGVAPEAVLGLAQNIAAMPGLSLWGLMTVPPEPKGSTQAASAPDTEPAGYFAALAQLQQEVDAALGTRTQKQLSMGMSHDFASAIGEGATLVRIGTAIFGPRPPRRSAP